MLRFFASYSFVQGRVFNTITARLENAADRLYRNHLNYLKDRVAERGRTFRVVYTLGF
jgi:phosphate uptake regulator